MTREAGDVFACHVPKIHSTISEAIKCHYIVMHEVISDGKMKSHKTFLILKEISKWLDLMNTTVRHWKAFLQDTKNFLPLSS